MLEKSKQNTFKNQVLLYVEGLKQQAVLSGIEEGNIVLPSNNESIDIDVATINLEIDKNYTGKIRITNSNGKYEYTLIDVTGDGYIANGPINKITVTASGNKPDTPSTPTYTAYKIGDEVTLKDNSVWYVIDNSNSSNSTVTLFASQNIKNDASCWTTVQDEYKIAFDESNARSTENNSYCTYPANGCNIYSANGSTVTEDSTIKKFLDVNVKTYINKSLISNKGVAINSIRLITSQEICNIINTFDISNNCVPITTGYVSLKTTYTNVPEWLYSTYYWTMTSYGSHTSRVFLIDVSGSLGYYTANNNSSYRARPVIITNKSNIK